MRIRRFTESDATHLYEVLSDPEVMKYIEPPYSMEKTKQFINNFGLCEPPKVYAAENDEAEFVGYVIFHEYDSDSMEIGWLLKKKHWEKGYATELTKVLLEWSRNLGKNAVIEYDPKHDITRTIALNAGFEYMGIIDNLCVFRKAL